MSATERAETVREALAMYAGEGGWTAADLVSDRYPEAVESLDWLEAHVYKLEACQDEWLRIIDSARTAINRCDAALREIAETAWDFSTPQKVKDIACAALACPPQQEARHASTDEYARALVKGEQP